MNYKNIDVQSSSSVLKPWIIACAIFGVLPGIAMAQVTGVWETTALTRIDLTPIKAPGLSPEHTVDIYDGIYTFEDNGNFNAEDIYGTWRQKKNQYIINIDPVALENQYRASMLKQEPGIIINQLKLVKRKLTGYELDDGIWGSERFEYKIDTVVGVYHDVYRLVITVQVAGKPPAEAPAEMGSKVFMQQSVDVEPEANSAVDKTVATLLRHLKQRHSNTQ